VQAEEEEGVFRREAGDDSVAERDAGQPAPEVVEAEREAKVARHQAPVQLHRDPVVLAPEVEGALGLEVGQPAQALEREGRPVALAGEDPLGAGHVPGVDEDVEVGEGAQGGTAVGGGAQQRSLEGDGEDAAGPQPVEEAEELRGQEEAPGRRGVRPLLQAVEGRGRDAAGGERLEAPAQEGEDLVPAGDAEDPVPVRVLPAQGLQPGDPGLRLA
jgi:hypothetical protein